MTQGRLVVVEGLEGAGKSTAVATLQKIIAQRGLEVITTREPGGTVAGEAIRTLIKHGIETEPLDPRTELLLFYAARVQLVDYVIKPALARGAWVLADRNELSSFAYQGGGRGLDEEVIQCLSSFCVGDLQTDLLFYLDISPEEGLKRASQRGTLDRIEQESPAFFTAVSAAYHRHLKTLRSVVIIDASQPLVTVQLALQTAMHQYLDTQHVSTSFAS